MTKICPSCNVENEDNSNFCEKCGTKLPDTTEIVENKEEKTINECPICKTKITNEKFCPKCGQKITNINSNNTNANTNITNNNANIANATNTNYQNNNFQKTTKFCENCGAEIDIRAEICPKCGVRVLKASSGEKNPVLALLLSFLFPGLGQFYNDQSKKGLTLLVGAIISLVLIFILIGGILYLLVWVYGLYDAYKSAEAINRGEILEDKLFS